jgi:AcrR family transcriptional regulator
MYVNNMHGVCMQDESRRTNKQRSETMRAALVTAARALFVRDGFAATGTPEIVTQAGVTRGALYHHFADKTALFDAVVVAEAQAIAAQVRQVDYAGLTAEQALLRGGDAFLAAMQGGGRARLMLREAPAVLGLARLAQIDAETGGTTLIEGLAGQLRPDAPLRQVAAVMSAAFDRAALAIDAGEDVAQWRAALKLMVAGVLCEMKSPA